MRSSQTQYEIIVDFMEAYGDLSKPTGGPRDRHFIQKKWRELALILNNDRIGDPRSEEKWRKVWSDYKNNTKKKYAKMTRASSGTGGPPIQLSLSDLETRVMKIIAASGTGLLINAGLQQESNTHPKTEVAVENDWNIESTSQPLPPSPHADSHSSPPSESQTPPPTDALGQQWQYAREGVKAYELEKERLRLINEELRIREFEAKERVRQRDEELRLQGYLLDVMKGGIAVFAKYLERK